MNIHVFYHMLNLQNNTNLWFSFRQTLIILSFIYFHKFYTSKKSSTIFDIPLYPIFIPFFIRVRFGSPLVFENYKMIQNMFKFNKALYWSILYTCSQKSLSFKVNIQGHMVLQPCTDINDNFHNGKDWGILNHFQITLIQLSKRLWIHALVTVNNSGLKRKYQCKFIE